MTTNESPLTVSAARLGETFDQSFAEGQRSADTSPDDFLSITVGNRPYALRVHDLSSVSRLTAITPLPTRVPELMGLAGLRGTILPVYDLAALLGHTGGRSPRWMAIPVDVRVGLAFEALAAHVRVGQDRIVAHVAAAGALAAGLTAIRIEDRLWPILSMTVVRDAINERIRAHALVKER